MPLKLFDPRELKITRLLVLQKIKFLDDVTKWWINVLSKKNLVKGGLPNTVLKTAFYENFQRYLGYNYSQAEYNKVLRKYNENFFWENLSEIVPNDYKKVIMPPGPGIRLVKKSFIREMAKDKPITPELTEEIVLYCCIEKLKTIIPGIELVVKDVKADVSF